MDNLIEIDRADPSKLGKQEWRVQYRDWGQPEGPFDSMYVKADRVYLGPGGALVLKNRDGSLINAFPATAWESVMRA